MSTLTLTRPPVNTDVVRSPACDMPQYAQYAHRFSLVRGTDLLVSAATLPELLDAAGPWNTPDARIVEYPVTAFARGHGPRRVGNAPWAGGTWGRRCGSTIWILAAEHADVIAAARTLFGLGDNDVSFQRHPWANDDARLTQAFHLNGVADNRPEIDGLFVECQQVNRHLGLCGGAANTETGNAFGVEWDWRDYAPYSDAGEQLALPLSLF